MRVERARCKPVTHHGEVKEKYSKEMYQYGGVGTFCVVQKLKLAENKMFDRLSLISLYRCVMKLFTSNNVNSEIKKELYISFSSDPKQDVFCLV